ncbi:hypothetical protein M9M37_001855 [Escherichia coli]|uniref:DUF7424 family protein n=1 Tax=Escherichia coli TaxID=562 RepID=UPI0010F006BC|nr:hypothetical protein [Escherichia coli]EJF8031392.1 hypothetical protein [Escherichia coli]MDF1396577.1 hypothetical protein [Escherichia coli]GDF32170.1 hypothetical protein HmCmsJML270_00781 [Escherichia coli]HAL6342311.1 hypothetical protein [Escherichia coli]HAX4872286.1 hypothetical protein [Escherichia coli]
MKIRKYLPICIALVLTGCKVELTTIVNMDDVLSREHKEVTADLNFEVAACNDYEDSRKESQSLTQVKEQIPDIFDGAKYVECYNKKLNSYAHFRVPVDVGAIYENMVLANPNADIFVTSKIDDGNIAVLALSDKVRAKLDKAKKSAATDFDFDISVTIIHPSNPIKFVTQGIFVTNSREVKTPIDSGALDWNTPTDMTFTLSDVGRASLFKNGVHEILMTEARAIDRIKLK